MALQMSRNRRSSFRNSSEPLAGVVPQRLVLVIPLDRLPQAVSLDEPHRVVRSTIVVGAQAVDRHDARVFKPASDLGLDEEPLAAGRVIGVMVEDLLQRHLAVQLGVQRQEDGPQAPLGVRPQDAEPLPVAGGAADGVGRWVVGVAGTRLDADVGEAGLDIGSTRGGEALECGAVEVERGQALLKVARVEVQIRGEQGLHERPARRVQDPLLRQDIRHRTTRSGPDGEGGHELVAADHAVLQGEQAEQKVTGSVVASGHQRGSRPGRWATCGRCPAA